MSRVDEAVAKATQASAVTDAVRADAAPLPDGPVEDIWASVSAVPAAVGTAVDDELEVPAQADATGDEVVHEGDAKLVTQWEDPRSIEQYRRLAARLHLLQAERGVKVVMVGSALPGEGKTLTAANLALTLSHSYRRNVLLLDGDLRRPAMHRLFRVSNLAGLNDGATAQVRRTIPLIRWSDRLTLVTAGRPEPDPMSVLSSERMKEIVGEARARFEWVIIDTPPLGLLTDAKLLAALVDTVVLVVQANLYAVCRRPPGG